MTKLKTVILALLLFVMMIFTAIELFQRVFPYNAKIERQMEYDKIEQQKRANFIKELKELEKRAE